MFPDANQQPGSPAGLPPVKPMTPAQQTGSVTPQQEAPSMMPPVNAEVGSATTASTSSIDFSSMAAHEHNVAMQAKRLVAQYGNDPYKLAAAFAQLKADYLAQQYQITPNRSDQ